MGVKQMTCDGCQLWLDNCACLKCPNCKNKTYIKIEDKLTYDTENYLYIKIDIYMCKECNNIFGEEQ